MLKPFAFEFVATAPFPRDFVPTPENVGLAADQKINFKMLLALTMLRIHIKAGHIHSAGIWQIAIKPGWKVRSVVFLNN